MNRLQLCLAFSMLLAICSSSLADIVLYSLPGGRAMVLPEGQAKVLPGKSINYSIPNMGRLTLHTDTARIIKAPTRAQTFSKMLNRAKSARDADACLDAARFALESGLIKGVTDSASAAYKIDKDHPTVKRLVLAQKSMKWSLGDAQPTIDKMKEIVKRKEMKFEISPHYVLMHDVPDSTTTGSKKRSRALARLDLLEDVYKSYLFKFALEHKALRPPKERMMVLLFGQEDDYMHYVNLLDPQLKMASGFWSPKNNVAVYFDQGTTDRHQDIRKLADKINNMRDDLIRKRAKGGRDIIQFANTLDRLVEITREQSDVTVVSHEATHQLAGNTGLIPRGNLSMRWAHEGLASYFETPEGAGWGGIGAVNKERLQWYNALKDDREHSNIRFIVSDNIFDRGATHASQLHAYGQSWALTHFLMDTRFPKLVAYYRKIGKIEPDKKGNIKRSTLVEVFEETFGDIDQLEGEWRSYMSKLKTDTDRLLEKL